MPRISTAGHNVLAALIADLGVLTSVTAGALVGRFGRDVERFALEMARRGQIHNVASDAHDCHRRPPPIAEPLERCGLGPHIELLTEAVPRSILDGSDTPEHPGGLLAPRHRRRRGWPVEVQAELTPAQPSLTTAMIMPITTRATTSAWSHTQFIDIVEIRKPQAVYLNSDRI